MRESELMEEGRKAGAQPWFEELVSMDGGNEEAHGRVPGIHGSVEEGRHCKSARLLVLFRNGGGCGHCSVVGGDAGVEEGTGRGCRLGEERSGTAAAWGDKEELLDKGATGARARAICTSEAEQQRR